jgi:hypothetical protein
MYVIRGVKWPLDLKTCANYFVPRDCKLLKMAEEDVKPHNFHEMELDDRILKVNMCVVTRLFLSTRDVIQEIEWND